MLSSLRQKISKMMAPAAPLSAAEAISRMSNSNAVLLDVREAAEISKSGKAKGAKTIPLSQLTKDTAQAAGLQPNQPIFIYCATGMRSSMAGRKMANFGYRDLYNMGSFEGWKSAGGKSTK